jgi:hypothetical protein
MALRVEDERLAGARPRDCLVLDAELAVDRFEAREREEEVFDLVATVSQP